jgi:hypothetical protein
MAANSHTEQGTIAMERSFSNVTGWVRRRNAICVNLWLPKAKVNRCSGFLTSGRWRIASLAKVVFQFWKYSDRERCGRNDVRDHRRS